MNIIQQSRKIYVFVFDVWRKEVRKAKVLSAHKNDNMPLHSGRLRKSLRIHPHNGIHGQNCTDATLLSCMAFSNLFEAPFFHRADPNRQ